MDDEADILRKADALLSKRRPDFTMAFPVLTEVVEITIAARQAATSTETEPVANGVVGGMRQFDANALEERVLARALTSSNAIISDWPDSSLRRELLFLIQTSIDKLEQDVTAILSEKLSVHVRASIQNALEAELLEIRNGQNPDKRI